MFERSASKSAMECPSTPAAPWFALTLLYASHTSRFGMSNGFALSTGLLPSPVDPAQELNNAAPSIQLHYRVAWSPLPTAGSEGPSLLSCTASHLLRQGFRGTSSPANRTAPPSSAGSDRLND